MATAHNQVLFPSGFQELFSLWNRFPEAIPYAGGTEFTRDQDKRLPVLPGNIISLENMTDLKRVTRTERYLEIGSMVCLSEIINLGKIVPEILIKTLEGIAGLHIRNTATIGGNLCVKNKRLNAAAPLAALDAQFELRSADSTRWISAARFSTPLPPALSSRELLTRIRIPLDQWNYSRYLKFKNRDNTDHGSVIVFILKNQKDTLTDLRIAFSGTRFLQNRQSSTPVMGKRLPLDQKEAQTFCEDWKKYLENLDDVKEHKDELLYTRINNFIEETILDFAD